MSEIYAKNLSYTNIKEKSSILLSHCPGCGSNNLGIGYREPYAVVRRDEILKGHRTISICKDCGTGFSSETVPKELLKPIYDDGVSGDTLVQKVVHDNRFQLKEEQRDFALKDFFTDPPKKQEKYAVCDVGCSGGDLLSVFDSSEWDCFGAEASPNTASICRKRLDIDVKIGNWDELEVESEKFDLIVSTHTLEHCFNPKKFLENCYKAIKTGGYLFIEVPDTENAEWWSISPYNPTHVIHYFLNSLVHAIESAGFSPLQWEKSYLSEGSGVKDGILRVTARKKPEQEFSGKKPDPEKYIDIIKKKRKKTEAFSKEMFEYVGKTLVKWTEAGKRISIYGANHHSANLLLGIPQDLRDSINITSFLDTSDSRIGFSLFGIPVLAFGNPINSDSVLISCRDSEETMRSHVHSIYPNVELCCPYTEMKPKLDTILASISESNN